MSRPWCRLYTGTRNHRKIRILREKCPATWTFWYVLIELAGEIDDGGWIYLAPDLPYDDKTLSRELGFCMEKSWRGFRDTLERLNLITVNEKGILLNSFSERNYESDLSTPRVQKYRERQKAKVLDETLQENVTETHQNRYRTDTEQIQNRTPLPPPRGNRPRKKSKIPLPPDFGISDEARRWAEEKGHNYLEDHLEAFREWALSTGKEYSDWDATFKRAIRENWGKVTRGSRCEPKGFAALRSYAAKKGGQNAQ